MNLIFYVALFGGLGAPTVVLPDTGVLSLSGNAPVVVLGDQTYCGLGSVVVDGFAPSLSASINVGRGEINALSFAPSLRANINVGLGELSLSGFVPGPVLLVQAYLGQLGIHGWAPQLEPRIGKGALVLTGFAPGATKRKCDEGITPTYDSCDSLSPLAWVKSTLT